MKRLVFLSCARPYNAAQAEFIAALSDYLQRRGLEPRTLGVTDYDMDAPLTAIRRMLVDANGMLTIAFRRIAVERGASRPGAADEQRLDGQWLSSPYAQIEPAMAFQLGLPVLIAREKGVIAEGVLERAVLGTSLPEFDLERPARDTLESPEWQQILQRWEGFVSQVLERKGQPPALY